MIQATYDSHILYKRSSEGKIETWQFKIKWENSVELKLIYGELNGKLQEKVTIIKDGKNIGKKNETSPYEQACKDAESKFEKQLKKGYVKSLQDAQAGIVDKKIEGTIAPMLAVKFNDVKHKITYPKMIQAKLNGHRCTAIKRNGVVKLWSRGRKEITTCQHVLDEVSIMLGNSPDGTFLDGELYRHGWTLQKISSMAKRKQEGTEELGFNVYDCGIDNGSYQAPYDKRLAFLMELNYFYISNSVFFVATGLVNSEFEVMTCHDKFVSEGFEGAMLRDPDSVYEYGKRSQGLIKVKAFEDGEFIIRSVRGGNDKSVIFTVYDPEKDQESDVTMSGNKDDNQQFLTDDSLWKGKYLTVKYKEYTPDGKLFHANGLQIREDL